MRVLDLLLALGRVDGRGAALDDVRRAVELGRLAAQPHDRSEALPWRTSSLGTTV
jgi:hypothetical protein